MPVPNARKPSGSTLPSGRTTTRAISSGRMRPSELADMTGGLPAARGPYTSSGDGDSAGLVRALVEQLEERLHDIGVELPPRLAPELLDGLHLREPARVGTARRHRV